MTQKEYERLRTGYHKGYSYHQSGSDRDTSSDGYFAFFKLRCLVCFVLFLGLVAIDRRMDMSENENVQQVMSYLNEETIPVGEIIEREQ